MGRFDDNGCIKPSSFASGAQETYNLLTDWADASNERVWMGITMPYDNISVFLREREYLKHLSGGKNYRMHYKQGNLLFAHYSSDILHGVSMAEVFKKEIRAWEKGPKTEPLIAFFAHSYYTGYCEKFMEAHPTNEHLGDEFGGLLEIHLEPGKQYWISTGPNQKSLEYRGTSFANFGILDADRKTVTLRRVPYIAPSILDFISGQ
ncbi:MAG: hypothetical protein ABIF85_04145 [Nanoarchaeota archaeon]|nr:hypothetical protein [Nanoarchaeota archaeon]MBU4300325.1 hypothetical protein [Nanoarchaeota archaeon]MBU4452600.1 hypothetical protein [Nanoarchaeota archaeon]MCG2723556.1 hypothetical protein [archaeon]